MSDEQIRTGVSLRSAGTRRLRRLSRGAALGTAALAAVFTAVAARSNPGHKHAQAQTVTVPKATTPAVRKVPPPPALPGDSSASAAAPLAQSPAPTPVQQQPVVVSGGS